jgi:hypothetical protein
VNRFRERLKPFGKGETVKLAVERESVTVETQIAGVSTGSPVTASGGDWSEALPDLRKMVEANPGKIVTVSAERAKWDRDVTVVLSERPGTRTVPLPENATLCPALERLPLEPEAAFARTLIERTGLQATYDDLRHRLEDDENIEDAFRLKTVRYLKRDPLSLPGATKVLGRALAPLARSADLAAICSVACHYLDCETAPILTTVAPHPPPRHASVEAHVNYCLDLMRRARDLVSIALSALTLEEKQALERDLPTLAEKFKDNLYLHEDEDQVRWKRHQAAIVLLAKVDRGAMIQGLAELAPLARPAYLEQLSLDLKEAEAVSRGFFSEYFQGANGWLLYQGTSELGDVVVGGSGSNGYRGDYALVIDLGGDDKYYRRAGGARGLARPVAVAIDLDGDDLYQATEPFSQGASLMGVGLLVDRRGNDRYTSMENFAQGASLCGASAIVDLAGNDTYRADSYAQGSALAQGLACLVDCEGDDYYEAGHYAQGFAGPGAFGVLLDGSGNDHYVALGRKKCSYGEDGVFDAESQGSSCGFRGQASGGIGVLVDAGGNDVYEAGNFSQGCGYYFGWGVLCDLGSGNDHYQGSRYAQAAAAHSALGSLWDEGGDDQYEAWIGAAQSLAWDLSVTAFMDESGNDHYDGGYGTSLGASAHNGFSLFYDGSGKDTYHLHRKSPAPAGPNDYHGGPSLSIFMDGGGEANVYDTGEGVAFVPSRGVAVSGDKSIFSDLPSRVEGMDRTKLDALLPPGK